MTPSTARDWKPAEFRGSFGAWLACLAALFSAACSDPEPRVIARFPADVSAGAGGLQEDSGGGGTDASAGDTSAAGAAAGPLTIPIPRGRVQVSADGKLVTDLGTPLRGLVMPVDTGWTVTDFGMLRNIGETTGLNAVHVYLENADVATGVNESTGDVLVALAAEAGLYVVIGYGTGTSVGSVDAAKLKAFWAHYAARYAARTHVLFEIQNNPEFTCDKPIAAATLTTERDTYAQIRAAAPASHILLFSTTSLVQASVFTDAVKRLGTSVDWSNASFALDVTADCLALADFGELTAAAQVAKVPLVVGQLPRDGWGPYITRFEQDQLSWFQFRWFANNKDIPSLTKAITAAAVTWCPERGTFPENSATCR